MVWFLRCKCGFGLVALRRMGDVLKGCECSRVDATFIIKHATALNP